MLGGMLKRLLTDSGWDERVIGHGMLVGQPTTC